MRAEPLITMDAVSVRMADRRILKNVSWRIQTGENWVIWGPNGAGKSTLAGTLLGRTAVVAGYVHRHRSLLSPTSMAMVSAEQYHHLYAREQRTAQMRSFSGRVHDVTTAGQALGLAAGDQSIPPEWACWPEISQLASKPLAVLSSGEIRKLLIVRALAERPRLLILDEPLNGLDEPSRRQFSILLHRLNDAGIQMVFITHTATDIPDFCTHALILDQGGITDQGPLCTVLPGRLKDVKTAAGNGSHARECPVPAGPPSASDELIGMHAVTVRYGESIVLDQVTWSVRCGENWALTGPNGAGKTTLLKVITSENMQAYTNRLTLFGRIRGSGESIWQIRRHIGYVADDLQARYQQALTGLEVVCSGFFDSIGLYSQTTDEQRRIARHWMERLDIAGLSEQMMARLSFGQQRILLIARAMVKEPRLLILDEPCNGLDVRHRRLLLDLLDQICRGGKTSLLYATHRSDELPGCITHRLCLAAGRMVESSSMDQRTRHKNMREEE